MRSPLFVFLLFGFVNLAHAQSDELLVQGPAGKLYLEHTVVAKENWYSIGRLYNANPKELASFNHLVFTKPLDIGQTLQIPLNATNFSQNGQKLPSETLVPVYHVIQEKEWLYRISINYNKVPVPSLEKWNHINKDQAKAGMHLIVGYLKVKTALSALATISTTPSTAAIAPASNEKPAGATPADHDATTDRTTAVANPAAGATKTTTPPAIVTPTTAFSSSKPAGTTSKTGKPSASDAGNPAAGTVVSKPAINPSGAANSPAASNGGAQPPVSNMAANGSIMAEPILHFNGGYFRNDFTEAGKALSGQAGTFKSTSGWQDGKYYALMNNVPVGTIVKVSVPGTDKAVYAKILGQLPDMKESVGLLIRISNAAASELGTGDGRFNVGVAY